MYRFLLTPRWLGAAVLTVAAAAVMVLLGNWQLHRYSERSAINARIDAVDSTTAVALQTVLAAPTAAGTSGAIPGKALAWTKVTVSGRYDPAHEIQARGRTVDGDVGYEIVTPLLLPDGTAVLVDRGWVPAPAGGAAAAPTVPPAPTGEVTVVGQLHLSESRPAPIARRNGRLDTRRISVPRLAHEMPYPVYGAYVLLTSQTPVADAAFSRVPIEHEDSWQNGGYAVQWWLFAGMTLVAYGWQARREAQFRTGQRRAGAPEPSRAAFGDRVAAADRDRAAHRAPALDRVEEADRKRQTTDPVSTADPDPAAHRAPALDRVEEADRKRQTTRPADPVEEADRSRERAATPSLDRVEEAERRLAAQSGQD